MIDKNKKSVYDQYGEASAHPTSIKTSLSIGCSGLWLRISESVFVIFRFARCWGGQAALKASINGQAPDEPPDGNPEVVPTLQPEQPGIRAFYPVSHTGPLPLSPLLLFFFFSSHLNSQAGDPYQDRVNADGTRTRFTFRYAESSGVCSSTRCRRSQRRHTAAVRSHGEEGPHNGAAPLLRMRTGALQ